MKKRRINKKRVLIFLVVPLLVITAGVTLSFMFKASEEKHNDFIPAQVTCEVNEVFDGSQKSSITIMNTGNIEAYLRLRLVSYWVDSDGNIVGKESDIPEVNYDSAYWITNSEDVYYYTAPVMPGMATAHDLLKSPIILEESTYLGKTVYQVVEVFAEGVQSEPSAAVEEAWGVVVSNNSIGLQ